MGGAAGLAPEQLAVLGRIAAMPEGTVIDFVRYPYPPLEAPAPGPSGISVAGLRDLAAMKLAAIAHRGIRRDFWDLFAITGSGHPGTSLAEATDDYLRKFGRQERGGLNSDRG